MNRKITGKTLLKRKIKGLERKNTVHPRMNQIVIRGGSRTAATSKMEHFVIIANGWKPLTIITKSSILDVAAVLDPPLVIVTKIRQRTQILTMAYHQNLQRKKYPRMSIPHQDCLSSPQRKRINRNLEIFKEDF